jgi:hypothetical protein
MNRPFLPVLFLLSCFIWVNGCSRTDKSEPLQKGTESPGKVESTKPARTTPPGLSVDADATVITPGKSDKSKPEK